MSTSFLRQMRLKWTFASLVLVGWLAALGAHAKAPPAIPVAWTAPQQLRMMNLEQAHAASPWVEQLDPGEPVRLKPGAELLFPVSAGELIRVEGDGLEIGLASGAHELPDAVVWLWQRQDGGVHRFLVPTWSSARFAVVRASPGALGRARVFSGAPLRRPFHWYRADEAVARWLWSGAALPRYKTELGELAPVLRWLEALRSGLGKVADSEAARSWLQAQWLEASARIRPLDPPFTSSEQLNLVGGRSPSPAEALDDELDEDFEHRLLGVGQRLVIKTERAAVVSLLVRTRAVGRSFVRIREGDTVVASIELRIPRRAENHARWAPSRLVKLVASRGLPMSVEVERGAALIAVRAARQRTSLFDGRSIRDRDVLLGQARTRTPATDTEHALQTLAEFALTRSSGNALELASLAKQPEIAPALRAVIWHELASHPLDTVDGVPLTRLWETARALSPELGLPLKHASLAGAARAGVVLPAGTLSRELGSAGGKPLEDALVVEALRELVTPEEDGARPHTSVLMDQLVAEVGPRDDLTNIAHDSWRKSAPWAWADPIDDVGVVTRLRPVYDTLPDERCTTESPDGLRWLWVGPETLDIGIVGGPGTHARIPVRGEFDTAQPESLLAIDDTGFAVHGGAGLSSVVAVAPGRHRLGVARGSPVLARIPLTEPVPCGKLRDVERWVYVAKTARFKLGAVGEATVGSVIADRQSMDGEEREIAIQVGNARFTGWFAPSATGEIEFPVAADAAELEVAVSQPLLLRVRVRLHPRSRAPRPVRLSRDDPPQDAPSALERVRQLTRDLRLESSAATQIQLRLARAEALDTLGYARLALLDRTRAKSPEPSNGAPTSPADYVELPEPSPIVVPLGSLAKIPPLPLPRNRASLDRALALETTGAPKASVFGVLRESAQKSHAADALLLGTLAEELGDVRTAAAAFERIAEAHASGEAFSRSAVLYTDLAVLDGSRELALKAYVLARRAVALGTSALASLGRLDQAIAWQSLSADSAAGVTWIEERRKAGAELAPSDQLRSALLDAPASARLFSGPELRIALERVSARALEIAFVCHALDGDQEPCAYRIDLDGKPAECTAVDPVIVDGVAAPHRCQLALPLGARELAIVAPEGQESIGFVDVRRADTGDPLPLSIVGRWSEVAPGRPLKLSVLGPTVLRIAARAYAGSHGVLNAKLRSLGRPGEAIEQTLALDANVDDQARRVDSGAAVTVATREYLTVPLGGPVAVVLSATDRALVRLERATAVSIPRPRTDVAIAASPPAADAPGSTGGTPLAASLDPARVRWDPKPGRLTVSGYVAATTDALGDTDADPRTTYAEIGGELHRVLVPEKLWFEFAGFSRVRSGRESFGARTALHLGGAGLVPGAFLRARWVAQPFAGLVGHGGSGTLGVVESFDLNSDVAISSLLALVVRSPDPRVSGLDGVDPDVRTSYSATHPWSLDVAVYADQRPALDAFLRYGVFARLLNDFRGLDRSDASARIRVVPGAGWTPSVAFESTVSYRPSGPERDKTFVRLSAEPSAFVWHWDGPVRWSAGAVLGYSADLPASAGRGMAFEGQLVVAGDLTFGRGLSDFSPADRVFRARLEEGADLAIRKRSSTDPYWEDE